MKLIGFTGIYGALLLVAALSALVVPKPFSDRARAQLQMLFTPVSSPVRSLAAAVYDRVNPPPADLERTGSPRPYQQIAEENRELRVQVAYLTEQLQSLQQLNADREALGSLRQWSRPMRVAAADPGGRKSISLQGPIEGIKPGMAVLYPGGLAGKIDRAGFSGGLQAQLVTDRTFRVIAKFGRLERQGDSVVFRFLSEAKVVLQGDGDRALRAQNVARETLQEMGLREGDFAVVADVEYPDVLQGYRIGQVTSVKPSRSPQFMSVEVSPDPRLMVLQEVMVLVR